MAVQAARSNWYWRQPKVSSACFVPGDNSGNVTGNFPASPFESPEQSQGSFSVVLKFGKTKKEKEIKLLQLIKEEKNPNKPALHLVPSINTEHIFHENSNYILQ